MLSHGNAAVVPQMGPQQYARLTTSQQAELELARRRAQKAAEGKRANATAARSVQSRYRVIRVQAPSTSLDSANSKL